MKHQLRKTLLTLFLLISGANCLSQNFLNANDYGVSPGQTGAANYTNLTNLLNNQNRDIYIPDGTYNIDNGDHEFLLVSFFTGHLLCGANTIFQFTAPTQGGFKFFKCGPARLENLNISYPTSAAITTNKAGINLYLCDDIVVENIRVNGAGGVGIQFDRCKRPQVSNININHVLKDGCGFYYCEDAQLNGLITYDTGDDALSVVNQTSRPNYNGLTASNLILKNSNARGIAVLGGSNVAITNFTIDSTRVAGIYVAQERFDATNTHRKPYNVTISNGIIKNGGQYHTTGTEGNPFGVHISQAGSVNISDLKIKNSRKKGFVIQSLDSVTVHEDIRVANVQIDSSGTLGFSLENAKYVKLNNIYINHSNEYGFKAYATKEVAVDGLTVINAQVVPAGTGSAGRAIWFENCTNFYSQNLVLIDTNPDAVKGYIVGEYNTLTKGYFGNIQHYLTASGPTFQLQSSSTNVKSGLVNLAPYGGITNGILYQGNTALKSTAAGTTGQILTNVSGVPAWTNPITVGGNASLSAISTTISISPGFTPTSIIWTPTNLAGSTQGLWYISNITSTSFTINYPSYNTGTITGSYAIIK